MKKYKVIGLMTLLSLGVCSCDRDEVFEKEQYKNVFALISESGNVFTRYYELGKETTGYVNASCGGTCPTKEDIVVSLAEDGSLISDYNTANFDVDKARYARPLPKSKYGIDSYQFTIPAGEVSGQMPIRVRPDGLSPDSAYMVALRISSGSACEVNPDKDYVLYLVKIENYWADSDGSGYTMKSKITQDGATVEVPGTVTMAPLGQTRVRIMAGNETYGSDLAVFNKGAIVLDIDTVSGKVTIGPYKSITVTQVDGDPDYPNSFRIEDDGYNTYKTFLLRYDYTAGNATYSVKEELRLEFDEGDETE